MDERDFHNQRRNLLIMSFSVLIANLGGVSALTALGTNITIQNNHLTPVFLFIIQIYFLIRYILSFYEHRPQSGIYEYLQYKFGRRAGAFLLQRHRKCDPGIEDIYRSKPRVIGHFNIDTNDRSKPRKGNLIFLENIVYDKNNQLHTFTTTLSARRIRYYQFLATLDFIFTSPKFLEFHFPPLFALLALATFNDSFKAFFLFLLNALSKII